MPITPPLTCADGVAFPGPLFDPLFWLKVMNKMVSIVSWKIGIYTLKHERIMLKSSECTILMANQKKLLTVKELEGVIVYPEVLCCYANCWFLFSHQMTDLSLQLQTRVRHWKIASSIASSSCCRHWVVDLQHEDAVQRGLTRRKTNSMLTSRRRRKNLLFILLK